MPKRNRSKPTTPQPPRLRYGTVYCETCHQPLRVGQPVTWQHIQHPSRTRWTAHHPDCHPTKDAA